MLMKKSNAFSMIEIMVVIAIVGMIAIVAVPAYIETIQRANVTKMANKLGTFKLALTDAYMATSAWPTEINGAAAGSTVGDSFFSNAPNFRYNTDANKAWIGYQLSSDYGAGWIFLVIIANEDDSFDVHCGSLNSTCTLGSCNSQALYPSACSEEGMDAAYSLE